MRVQALMHRLRLVTSATVLVAVAFAPFGVYFATRGDASVAPRFPADVVLVAVRNGVLREIGVLRPTPVPGIVRFPSDTALVLPRAGTLRAATAFSIVGSSQLGDAIAATLGVRVPFWIQGETASVATMFAGEVQSNLGDDLEAARALYERGLAQIFRGAGSYQTVGVTRSFVPNAAAVRAALRDPALRVDPKPVVRLAPKNVRVDVLNKSGLPNAAARIAEALRKKGFRIVRTGTSTLVKPATTIVYYAKNKAMADLVVKALGIKGLKATALPKDIKVTGDVLVLVGRDAFPAPAK